MNMMITLHWLTIILQVIPGEIDEFEGVPESIVVDIDTVRAFTGIGYYGMKNNT
jgi:hypothetical protein